MLRRRQIPHWQERQSSFHGLWHLQIAPLSSLSSLHGKFGAKRPLCHKERGRSWTTAWSKDWVGVVYLTYSSSLCQCLDCRGNMLLLCNVVPGPLCYSYMPFPLGLRDTHRTHSRSHTVGQRVTWPLPAVHERLSLRGNTGIFSQTDNLSKPVVERGLRCLLANEGPRRGNNSYGILCHNPRALSGLSSPSRSTSQGVLRVVGGHFVNSCNMQGHFGSVNVWFWKRTKWEWMLQLLLLFIIVIA